MSEQKLITVKNAPRGFVKIVKTWRDDCDAKADLSAMRETEGWSVRELAGMIGISHATLSRIERGQEPSLANAFRVAHFWQVKIDDIWQLRKGL